VAIESRETAPIDGSASPRKPNVSIASRSSSGSLEVAWRSTYQPAAAAVGQHIDAARPGVERILDQFLDDARRPLDHLARGDAVDDGLGQRANGHLDNIALLSRPAGV
jgi:hypothetical protein